MARGCPRDRVTPRPFLGFGPRVTVDPSLITTFREETISKMALKNKAGVIGITPASFIQIDIRPCIPAETYSASGRRGRSPSRG